MTLVAEAAPAPGPAPLRLVPPATGTSGGAPGSALEPLVLAEASRACGVDEETLARAVAMALLPDGPDSAVPGWWEHAPCAGLDPDIFYPRQYEAQPKLIRSMCSTCVVRPVCLGAALWNGEQLGWWGGTSAHGRQKLRTVLRTAGVLGVAGEDAYLSWRENDRDPPDLAPEPIPVRTPWPHQLSAVDAIVHALAKGGRCQVAIATAAGKTHVAMWSATALGVTRVMILVPSLTLVTQTADVWASDPNWSTARRLAVCSDVGDLDLEATLDPARVREFVDAPGPSIVFGTYQSAEVIADAGCRFHYTVADEAHHLAGDVDKAFGIVRRGEIPTDRLLFMTATPRRVTRHGHARKVSTLVGMDEPAFGPRVFDFPLSAAVAAGVVADYRVIVAAVEREVLERVAALPEMRGVDSYLLAGAIAVVRAMGEYKLESCLSFHNRVDRAREFSELVGAVAEALDARPSGPGWSGFVHGGASVRIRRRLLTRLSDPRTWGVLANARAVGEGVDVPTLDAVAIVDPKSSETDVMQACGRALRRPHRGSLGTVILPVLLGPNPNPDDPLGGADERSLELVGGVLRALSAHDSELAARMGSTRRRLGGYGPRAGGGRRTSDDTGLVGSMRRQAAMSLLQSRVQLRVPGGAAGALAGAIALHVIREATSPWDEAYGRLAAYVAETGVMPGQTVKVPDEDGTFSLGAWCTVQRTLRRREMLPADRAALLEAVPGWTWDPRHDGWWQKFDALRDYVEVHGHYPNQRDAVWQDVHIGRFLNVTRSAMTDKDGRWLEQFPDRIAALEALPGWVWNTKDAQWNESFERCRQFILAHRRMPTASDDNLGRWIVKQRARMRNGELDEQRVARLRALPGWIDDCRDVLEDQWDANLALLVDFVERRGHLPRRRERYGNVDIGDWAARQRELYTGRRHARGGMSYLSSERAQRLEREVSGWSWDWVYGEESWESRLSELEAHSRKHRVFGQPLRLPTGPLADWATTQRMARAQGKLRGDRMAALSRVPGWSWSVHDAKAEAAERAAASWLARMGPLDPPTSHREDGVPLRAWVIRWRREEAHDQIDPARAERLEAMPGWSWSPLPSAAVPAGRDPVTGQWT